MVEEICVFSGHAQYTATHAATDCGPGGRNGWVQQTQCDPVQHSATQCNTAQHTVDLAEEMAEFSGVSMCISVAVVRA